MVWHQRINPMIGGSNSSTVSLNCLSDGVNLLLISWKPFIELSLRPFNCSFNPVEPVVAVDYFYSFVTGRELELLE